MRLDYKWQVALIGALGLFMAILDTTIVSVALPKMQSYFHTDRDTITWVANGYLLASAAVIPITGYLSDRIGSKITFLSTLALFTVGSALCAVAPNEQALIAFRIFQGLGGGAMMPIVLALVYRVFPPAERGGATAVVGVPILLAPAFGPTVGGYLTTTFDWHAIFTINLPIGVIAFILGAIFLKGRGQAIADGSTGEEPLDSGRFDFIGLLFSMAGFTAIVYGISRAGSTSWTDQWALISLIGGGILLVVFTIVELNVSDPVMDVRLFLNYTFTSANILTWAISGFLFGSIYLLPIFFQTVQGHNALQSGEFVIVQGLGAAIATGVAGRLYNALGPKVLAVAGFILVTAGTWQLAHLDPTTSWQSLQPWLFVRGLGLGAVNIPLQTLVMSVVSNKQMARASSLTSVTRQSFGAIGLAALTTVFSQNFTNYRNNQIATAVPAATRAYVAKQTAPAVAAYIKQQAGIATQAAVNAYTAGSPTNPSTPLGNLTAQCAAQYGATASQHAADINACVSTNVANYAQSYGTAYALLHQTQFIAQYQALHAAELAKMAKDFAANYVLHTVIPATGTHALNDAFWISFIGCAAGIVLALFLGNDPNVKAIKDARKRGDKVESRQLVMSE
jgi:EmrB/QacA subfamily drug resistance transporter